MPTAPVTEYVGLFTANPADTGTTGGTADGTEVTTTNGIGGFAGYLRGPLTSATGWGAISAASGDATGQQISTTLALPVLPASWTNNGGSTVTITGIGVWDAATAGNLLLWIAITPQPVAAGTAFGLGVAGLSFAID